VTKLRRLVFAFLMVVLTWLVFSGLLDIEVPL